MVAQWGSTRLSSATYSRSLRTLGNQFEKIKQLTHFWHHYHAFVACPEMMGVEKSVKEIFEMLLSAEMDIYVHHLMTASTLQDLWRVHKRYSSYTKVIDIILGSNIFWYFIHIFFLLHDRSMKRKRGRDSGRTRGSEERRHSSRRDHQYAYSPKSMKKINTRTLNKVYFQFDHFAMNNLYFGTKFCLNDKVCVGIPIIVNSVYNLLYCNLSLSFVC